MDRGASRSFSYTPARVLLQVAWHFQWQAYNSAGSSGWSDTATGVIPFTLWGINEEAGDLDDTLFTIDLEDISPTIVPRRSGPRGAFPAAISFRAMTWDGTNMWAAGDELYRIERSPPSAQRIGPFGSIGQTAQALAFDGSDLWLAAGPANPDRFALIQNTLYRVSRTTGALTRVGPENALGRAGSAMAWDGTNLYATGYVSFSQATGSIYNLYTISRTTAGITQIGPTGAVQHMRSMVWTGSRLVGFSQDYTGVGTRSTSFYEIERDGSGITELSRSFGEWDAMAWAPEL